MTDLPEGAELELLYYLTGDSHDGQEVNVRVRCGCSATYIWNVPENLGPNHFAEKLSTPGCIMRPMTRVEIAEYKEREKAAMEEEMVTPAPAGTDCPDPEGEEWDYDPREAE